MSPDEKAPDPAIPMSDADGHGDAARWRRVEELWQEAEAMPVGRRPAFLDQACGSDLTLKEEVIELLAAGEEVGEHLEGLVDQCWVSMAEEEITLADRPAPFQGPPSPLDAQGRSLTGRSFGYVRVEEQLGEGGMGRVYRGLDDRLGRRVALKVLRPEWISNPQMVNRLKREARLLSQLEHPAICRLYDVMETEDGVGLVLELAEGEQLAEVIARGCSRGQVLEWAIELAGALAAAHGAGIVHRDLKPRNIMLNAAGDLKILDFGIARSVTPRGSRLGGAEDPDSFEEAADIETAAGRISGTLAYMSPEQFRGDPPSPATDIFALGLVLYECLSGEQAYSREKLGEILHLAVLEGRVPILPDTGDGLSPLIARMTAPATGARPSAADVLERLRWIERAPQRVRARRLRTAGVAALALFALVMTWQASRIAREAQRANQALEQVRTESARANREAEAAKEITGLLTGLLDVADPWQAGNQEPQQRRELAEQSLRDGWEQIRERSPQDPLPRATLYFEVAEVAINLEMLDIASEAAAEALELRNQYLGEAHADVAASLIQLADIDFFNGDLRLGLERVRHAKELLEPQRRFHPELYIQALDVLSRLLLDSGDFSDAESLGRSRVELTRRLWGEGSLEFMDASFLLGQTLLSVAFFENDQAILAKGALLLEENLVPTEEYYGGDHPSTALAYNYLGQAAQLAGEYGEARALAEKASRSMIAALGAESTETLIMESRFSAILRSQGSFEEAADILRRIIPLLENRSGIGHLDLLHPKREWGRVQLSLGNPQGAEMTARRTLDLVSGELSPTHWEVLELQIDIGAALIAQDRWQEAEALLLEVLAENQGPKGGYIDVGARRNLILLYESWGRPSEASPFLDPVTGKTPGGMASEQAWYPLPMPSTSFSPNSVTPELKTPRSVSAQPTTGPF